MKKSVIIRVVLQEGARIPEYASIGASGSDVRACIPEDMVIEPGHSALIPTGLAFEIPEGYEIQIRPRSGLALRHQITVLNTPGTIDSDYRGELKVILINHSKERFIVQKGMRIAQIIVSEVCRAEFTLAMHLESSTRGEGGFGHTGVL